jgi:hippurate hydrolase
VRSISERARRAAREKMQVLVAGIAAAHEIEAKLHWIPGYPVTVNDAAFTDFAREVARDLLGEDALLDMAAPVMGAEDFSYLLERVPGAMVFLGARPAEGDVHPLHSNRMRIDESVLAAGMALHAAVALRRLAPG